MRAIHYRRPAMLAACAALAAASATAVSAASAPTRLADFVQERSTGSDRTLASITGRVTDEATGRPLVSVQVFVAGTELGTTTDADGRYAIQDVPAGAREIRARLLGYGEKSQAVTVPAEGTVAVDFQLATQAIALDALLVTGTAGRQERRAQGAAIANVNVAQVSDVAPVTDVAEILQARVPGVSLTQGSGVAGSAQQIRIRGASSISLSNEPLIYIDGIRADARLVDIASGAIVSPMNDLSPSEIESIEIVKGPAAATLYGADASAGVIQIITKRGAAGAGFRQTFSLGYSRLDPDFTPYENFGVCRQVDLNIQGGICQGRAVGDIVSDSPMRRYGLPEKGDQLSFSWTTRGGGDRYGFFSAIAADRENGLFPNSRYDRYSVRANYNIVPADGFRLEVNFPITRVVGDFPVTAGSSRGWTVGGWAGTPLTVGTPTDGWFASNRTPGAIANIEHTLSSVRVVPDVKVNWDPMPQWHNRLTLGSDLSLMETSQLFPKNDRGWYSAQENRGQITETRRKLVSFTANYLSTVNLRITDSWGSSLSAGSEIQYLEEDETFAFGNSLTTNAARSVSAAAQVSGGQELTRDRRVGFYGQFEPNFRERLYLQFGLRADRFAAFGSDAPWFLSPSARVSYVLSEEPFWSLAWIPSLRLRAAYGTTGRAPSAGASLQTYSAAPYLTGPGQVASGIVPLNPGNAELEAERGEEFEAGFDAGLFGERVGLELTYFNKATRNLLLQVPQPPSLGFVQERWENIGEVRNRGFEVALRAQLLNRENLTFDVNAGIATLDNEVIDLGGVAGFSSIRFGSVNQVVEGRQVGAFYSHKIQRVDVAANRAIVSDTLEYLGNLMPTLEGNLSGTLTLFRSLRLYGHLDFKNDFMLYNATAVYRDRNFRIGERWIRRADVLTPEESIRLFGPYFTESGEPIGVGSVEEEFVEPADFVRLNELSLTYVVPQAAARRFFRASSASVTVSGRNLKLWTDYSGFSPDIQNEFDAIAGRADFFTLPPPQRLGIRLDVAF